MVTENPAKVLKMEDELGSLKLGRKADISLLKMENGRFTLTDNSGGKNLRKIANAPDVSRTAIFLRPILLWFPRR